MQINEILKPSEQSLFEAIDAENDTGLATSDLVKIIKSASGPFEGPFTGDEMIARLEAALGKNG